MSTPAGFELESSVGLLQALLAAWHEYRPAALLLFVTIAIAICLWDRAASRRPLRGNGDEEQKAPVSDEVAVEESAVGRKIKDLNSRADSGSDPRPLPVVSARPNGPKRIRGGLKPDRQKRTNGTDGSDVRESNAPVQLFVFYTSVTGSTAKIAAGLARQLDDAALQTARPAGDDESSTTNTSRTYLPTQLHDISDIDFDDYFVSVPKPPALHTAVDALYLILLPSYNIDTINDTFLERLRETHHDFRIDTAPLSSLLGYAVFGLGDREGWPTDADGFCVQAREVDRWMARLTGRKRAYPLGTADAKLDYKERLAEWTSGVREVLDFVLRTGNLGEGLEGSGAADESDEEVGTDDDDDDDKNPNGDASGGQDSGEALADVEDLGSMIRPRSDADADADADVDATATSAATAKAPFTVDFTTYFQDKTRGGSSKKQQQQQIVPKEMVPANSPTYAALTKQGYSIIGSHSGVKICRWTKSALRGRGSCYKFSFYGINSHQCMETTPSLACSNKCVFCWRHGTNPVGTTWRWVVDPPDLIFDGVLAAHYQKIKVLRGMAGVRAERFAEALRVRHCALSLVGEPVFYPFINEFLALLHARRISSFLVCNAQHPAQLAALGPVTQLYVSIDAPDRESLRRIDRPLHHDYWARFQSCLDVLRERTHRTRTVFRLTLVKGFNVDEAAEGYAALVERALPCFVEVKGVTFCGTSTSAGVGLTMANVPFYWEVCEFVRALERRLGERGLAYGIAAEHAHSCCVLLASDRFRVNGRWRTLIDYDRFFDLLEQRGAAGEWAPEEYMGDETPEWATWGNGGFDPRDERVDRRGRKIAV